MKYIKNNIVYDEYGGIPNAEGKLVVGMTKAQILALGYEPYSGFDKTDDGRAMEFSPEPYYIDFYSIYGETSALTTEVACDQDLARAITAYEDGRELIIRYWGEVEAGTTSLESAIESGSASLEATYYFNGDDLELLSFQSNAEVLPPDPERYTKSNYNGVVLSKTGTPSLSFNSSTTNFISKRQVDSLLEEFSTTQFVDLTKNAQGNFIVNSGSSTPEEAEYVRYVESSSPNMIRIFRRVSSKNASGGGSASTSGNFASYIFSEINETSNSINILVCTLGQGSIAGGDWQLIENLYQKALVSGENIKTINNESLLGSGDVQVGDITGEELDTEIEELESTLLTDALRKSEQILLPAEKTQVLANLGIADAAKESNLKTINGASIVGTGNIEVLSVNAGDIDVMQTTGTSTTGVMSQKAVTEYGRKITAEDLNGTSEWIRAKLTEEGWEFGKYLYTINVIREDAAYCVTPLIPINDIIGHSLTWDIGVMTNQINLWYIDANGTITGYVNGGTSSSSTRTITVASSGVSSAANATHLRISLSASNLPQCYIFDNTTGEYLLKVDEILSESCEDCNLPYGVFENTLLTQEEGDNSFKTMSQKAITKAIKYNMSITNCSCVYMDEVANFNLTDQQLKAFNSTDIITISFTIMPVLPPSCPTPWRYLRMYGATSLSSTDGFIMNCASSGRMYMQIENANNEPSNAAFNLLNGSIICPAVFNIVWDRVNGIVRFYERANLVTEKQDDKYKLSQFMGAEKILYFLPADSFSYLYDLQIYDYDIIGILDSDINGRSGASYINPVYDGNLKVLNAEWVTSGVGTYGNTTQLLYTYEDGNVIITSTDAAVAGTTTTHRGYYVGTNNIARIYESDIEVVSGTCKINTRFPSVINEIVDRNTGTVYAAGDELGVGEYTIKGRASTVGCWSLTYMSGSPMVVKHTANRQKYISCIMHLKCDTLYNGELYDDQADVFYNVPVAPDNTSFNKIQLTISNKPYFAGQMALNGNNVYVGDKNYTWKQINNS